MWEGFCEKLREYGRDGALFFVSSLVVLLSGLFWNHGGEMLLGGFVLIFLFRFGLAVANQRDRFEKLGRMPPLSERDLQVARGKLRDCRRSQ
jgi:hypothetical protein